MLRHLSVNILRPAVGGTLAPVQDVVVQDGSAFAVHDALARTFGGRCTTMRPAAVDVHTCLSLFHDQVIDVAVAPDTDGERQGLPPAETLGGTWRLADRGYQRLDDWAAVPAAGGCLLMRGPHDLHPRIRTVRSPHGVLPRVAGRRLQDVRHVLPRRRRDVDVEGDRAGGQTLRRRLGLIGIRPARAYTVLVSNVSRRILTARHGATVYRWRWPIALVCTAWQSYAHLHAFTRTTPAIVEGLIWASLCAAALTRSLAHVAPRRHAPRPIATRIVAMCGAHILPTLLRSALAGVRHLEALVHDIVRYLSDNAARAHPQRDRVRGRMRFGLEYVGARA